jgi:hypothetical protein
MDSMKTRFATTLAVAAGFVGGLASRYFDPLPVYAEATALPIEVRAQKFVLVDGNGQARGVFGIEKNGAPEIEVIDYHGHVAAGLFKSWSLVGGFLSESVSRGPKKPTLLP